MFGLSCEKTSQLVSKSLDCELSRKQRFLLNLHLMMCKVCRESANQISSLHRAFQEMNVPNDKASSEQLSAQMKQKIKEALLTKNN